MRLSEDWPELRQFRALDNIDATHPDWRKPKHFPAPAGHDFFKCMSCGKECCRPNRPFDDDWKCQECRMKES